MADKKISQLTALTAAQTDNDDVLPIVDTSAGQTKKIAMSDLSEALAERFGFNQASFTWDSDTPSPAAIAGGVTAPVVTQVHRQMRACVLNDDGTVNYYLDSTNWALKADGTASVLTGADGNVMIEIPKFWYQVVYVTTKSTWKISSVEASGFEVHPAFIKDGVEVDYRYYGAYDACLKFSRSITAVADAGGGDITVTTSVQHPLYAGDVVTISGTTSYDGTYTVVSRASTTTFTVTAAFVATETGTADGFVSGKNLDDMTDNIDAADEMASVKGFYPLVGVTRAECRTLGAAVGTGWRQLDFTLWSAVQMLYLVEYQSFFSQNILGAGNTNSNYSITSSVTQSNSPNTIAGAGDAIANGSTDTTSGAGVNAKPGTSFMKYRGIENFYGNVWNWADGINVNVTAIGNVWVTNNATNWADDTSTNYTLITSSLPTASGFIRNLLPVDGYFLSSSNSGGSSTTYITDQHLATTGNRIVLVGGSASDAANAGAFFLNSTGGSTGAVRSFGGRLSF